MKDLIQKTIARLKREKVRPIPKWRFILIEAAYWALVSLAIIMSSIAVATGGYLLFQIDWEASRYAPGGQFRTLFLYIPYVWLIILATLVGAIFYFIRKTKEGYKYRWIVIVVSVLSLVMAMGAAAHFAKIGNLADDFAYGRVPLYRNLTPNMEHMWQRTEDGFLAGEISSIQSNGLIIVDFDEKKWEILISERTQKRGAFELKEGDFIRIVGSIQSGNIFNAEVIMPEGKRMMRGMGRGPRGQELNRNYNQGGFRSGEGMMQKTRPRQ